MDFQANFRPQIIRKPDSCSGIRRVYDWKSVRLKECKIGRMQDKEIVRMCDFKFSGLIA